MIDVHEGDQAPDFTLPRSGGGDLSLHDLRGRKVVLYFYPKDDTTGCTVEACGFRDASGNFNETGAVVIGVSPDSVASHDAFAAKYNLPFILLADTDHAVAEKYGVWVEKSMYGRRYMGIQRSTFVIGEDGTLVKIWPDVKPADHADEVLAELRSSAAAG